MYVCHHDLGILQECSYSHSSLLDSCHHVSDKYVILVAAFHRYVAKQYGHSSVLGSYLDPLADKVLIGCVVGALGYQVGQQPRISCHLCTA